MPYLPTTSNLGRKKHLYNMWTIRTLPPITLFYWRPCPKCKAQANPFEDVLFSPSLCRVRRCFLKPSIKHEHLIISTIHGVGRNREGICTLQIVDATFNASYLLCIQGNYGIRPCSNGTIVNIWNIRCYPQVMCSRWGATRASQSCFFLFTYSSTLWAFFFFPCCIQGHVHFNKKSMFNIFN